MSATTCTILLLPSKTIGKGLNELVFFIKSNSNNVTLDGPLLMLIVVLVYLYILRKMKLIGYIDGLIDSLDTSAKKIISLFLINAIPWGVFIYLKSNEAPLCIVEKVTSIDHSKEALFYFSIFITFASFFKYFAEGVVAFRDRLRSLIRNMR